MDRVRLELSGFYADSTLAGGEIRFSIWRGAIGSGTRVGELSLSHPNAGGRVNPSLTIVDTPGAGTHLYRVGLSGTDSGQTKRLGATPTSPSTFMVSRY